MTDNDLLQAFPSKRIKAIDGMAVTAETWETAHDYHRQKQRFHDLFSHGPGIMTGLSVIASDPPDRSVFITPGIAVDATGQTIVVPQLVAYDFGDEIEGFLHLLLSHSESRPRTENGGQGDAPPYIHDEFLIVARPTPPDTPCVELARLTRENRKAPLLDAPDPAYPGLDEIDLRFRREIGATPRTMVTIAVSYLGEVKHKSYGRGAGYLARTLNRLDHYQVAVDDDIPLDPGVLAYTLIYLVGEGNFKLSRSQIKGLQGYVKRGGILLVESCDMDAGLVFSDYLEEMAIELEKLTPDHPILLEPFLFAAPPPGFETERPPEILVGEGAIFSTGHYGRLWNGERNDGLPARGEIRSALEWGANMVIYALKRSQRLVPV